MSLDETKKLNPTEHRELSKLGTQLDLLLNKKDRLQGRLWELADRIYWIEDGEQRRALDGPLMEAGRDVLKNEWEKVKSEMRGSEFQTGES